MVNGIVVESPQTLTQSASQGNKTFVVYDFENDKLYCVESSVDVYSPQYYDKYHKEWLQKVQELVEQEQKTQQQKQDPSQEQQDPSQQKPQEQQDQKDQQDQGAQDQQSQGQAPILTEDLLSKLLQALLQPVCLFGICLPLVAWIIIGFLVGKVVKKVL